MHGKTKRTRATRIMVPKALRTDFEPVPIALGSKG